MIVMSKVVMNFVSIASYYIAVKDIGKQPTKGLGQLNKTYFCVMHTNERYILDSDETVI